MSGRGGIMDPVLRITVFSFVATVVGVLVAVLALGRDFTNCTINGCDDQHSAAPTPDLTSSSPATLTESTRADPSSDRQSRISYLQSLTPVCREWRDRVTGAEAGLDPNQHGDLYRYYARVSPIMMAGSEKMQKIPQPDADKSDLFDIYNSFDIVAKGYGDIASTGLAGEQQIAENRATALDADIAAYNAKARSFGFNAKCLI